MNAPSAWPAKKDQKEYVTKWIFFAVIVGVCGYFVLPILVKIALNAVTLAILGLILFAIVTLLPAVSEWLALWAWRLWAMAIKTDPVARLWKDLAAHNDAINELEQRIADAKTDCDNLRDIIKESKSTITTESETQWNERLNTLAETIQEMEIVHREEVEKHHQFEIVVQRAEVEYRLGKAFERAFQRFGEKPRVGPESLGARIALDEVRRELASSHARLDLVLKRAQIERELSAGQPAQPLPGRSLPERRA